MSRPALYQHFSGKAQVFRAVGVRLVDELTTAAGSAGAAAGGGVADQLPGALLVKLGLVADTVDASVRRDLIAEATAVTGDLLASLREGLVGVVQRLLEAAGDELPGLGEVASARDVAALLVDALTGISQEPEPLDVLQARLHQLITLTVRGLTAPQR